MTAHGDQRIGLEMHTLIAAALVGAAALVPACGGDDSKGSPAGTGGESAEGPDAGTGGGAPNGPGGTPGVIDDGGPGSGGSSGDACVPTCSQPDTGPPGSDAGSLAGAIVSTGATPLAGVTVSVGTTSTVTDQDGAYSLEGLAPGEGVVIRFEKDGYARGLEVLPIAAGGETPGDFVMLAVGAEATFDAAAGGDVIMANGAHVSFPAGVIVDEAGDAVTGSVRVRITPIDPWDRGQRLAFPGEFAGERTDGSLGLLETVSPMTITVDQNGAELNIAEGSTAVVHFPANGFDDPTVPLWSLDEATGRWVEEGIASLTLDESGTRIYRAEIGHLSSWNVDKVMSTDPDDRACVRFCLRGAPDVFIENWRDQPIAYHGLARVSGVDYTYGAGWGTDSEGCAAIDVKGNGTIEYWGTASVGESEHFVATIPPTGASRRTNPEDCTDLGELVVNPKIVAVCQGLPGSFPAYCGDPVECVDLLSDEEHCGGCDAACQDANTTCVAGICTCPDSMMLCTGSGGEGGETGERQCIDTQRDRYNCGDCNIECPTGTRCAAGVCEAIVCGAGLTLCGNECVDVSTSLRHCGGCNQECHAEGGGGAACVAGVCACGDTALTDCDAGQNLFCVDTRDDRSNCGGCGISCDSGQECAGGSCEDIVCTVPTPDLCDESCVDTQADEDHCGGCNQPCRDESHDGEAGNAVCVSGTCVCTAGLTDCNASVELECRDLQTDRENCGACDVRCVTGQECVGGSCVPITCSGGTTLCGGTCVDLASDEYHCGACGAPCPGFSAECTGGSCGCPSGETACLFGEGVGCTDDTGFCSAIPASTCGDISGDWALDVCGQMRNIHFEQVSCAFQESNGSTVGHFTDASTVMVQVGFYTCSATLTGDVLSGTCSGGSCPISGSRPACPTAGEVLCGSECTAVASDPFNCGFCFNYCGSGASCSAGRCQP